MHTELQKTGIRASDQGSNVIYRIQIMHTRLQTTMIRVWDQDWQAIYRKLVLQVLHKTCLKAQYSVKV
jgi:hypothetical protein